MMGCSLEMWFRKACNNFLAAASSRVCNTGAIRDSSRLSLRIAKLCKATAVELKGEHHLLSPPTPWKGPEQCYC